MAFCLFLAFLLIVSSAHTLKGNDRYEDCQIMLREAKKEKEILLKYAQSKVDSLHRKRREVNGKLSDGNQHEQIGELLKELRRMRKEHNTDMKAIKRKMGEFEKNWNRRWEEHCSDQEGTTYGSIQLEEIRKRNFSTPISGENSSESSEGIGYGIEPYEEKIKNLKSTKIHNKVRDHYEKKYKHLFKNNALFRELDETTDSRDFWYDKESKKPINASFKNMFKAVTENGKNQKRKPYQIKKYGWVNFGVQGMKKVFWFEDSNHSKPSSTPNIHTTQSIQDQIRNLKEHRDMLYRKLNLDQGSKFNEGTDEKYNEIGEKLFREWKMNEDNLEKLDMDAELQTRNNSLKEDAGTDQTQRRTPPSSKTSKSGKSSTLRRNFWKEDSEAILNYWKRVKQSGTTNLQAYVDLMIEDDKRFMKEFLKEHSPDLPPSMDNKLSKTPSTPPTIYWNHSISKDNEPSIHLSISSTLPKEYWKQDREALVNYWKRAKESGTTNLQGYVAIMLDDNNKFIKEFLKEHVFIEDDLPPLTDNKTSFIHPSNSSRPPREYWKEFTVPLENYWQRAKEYETNRKKGLKEDSGNDKKQNRTPLKNKSKEDSEALIKYLKRVKESGTTNLQEYVEIMLEDNNKFIKEFLKEHVSVKDYFTPIRDSIPSSIQLSNLSKPPREYLTSLEDYWKRVKEYRTTNLQEYSEIILILHNKDNNETSIKPTTIQSSTPPNENWKEDIELNNYWKRVKEHGTTNPQEYFDLMREKNNKFMKELQKNVSLNDQKPKGYFNAELLENYWKRVKESGTTNRLEYDHLMREDAHKFFK
ncbi:hypothetical protein WDU94_002510 [Cyamophila willieti]